MCRRDSAISLAIRSSASLKHTHTQSVLQQWKYAPKQHRSKKLELCFKTTHTYSSWACCSSFLRRLICSWSSSRFPVLRLPSDPSFCRKWNTHKEKKRLKVRRGENSKGTNTKRKAGASATFGLAMHYALCIILTFERKPLAWILCPSFWQSENLWENKPCQWAQISSTQTLSPQKQLVLTGCRGKKSRRSSKKLALRPHRSAVRKGLLLSEKGGISAACLPMKLLLSSYTLIKGRTHGEERDKARITDGSAPRGTLSHFCYLSLIMKIYFVFTFFSSPAGQTVDNPVLGHCSLSSQKDN